MVLLKRNVRIAVLRCTLLNVYHCTLKQWHDYGQVLHAVQLQVLDVIACLVRLSQLLQGPWNKSSLSLEAETMLGQYRDTPHTVHMWPNSIKV